MFDSKKRSLLSLLLIACVGACAGPSGRIMADDEQDKVGDRSAGAASYQRLIQEAVANLLQRPSAQRQGADRLRIAFLDIENRSAEELVDWRDTLRQLIDEAVNGSGRYRNISDRFVAAALRESGIERDDLFIPAQRLKFMKTLEANGSPVDFLLYATLNSGTTRTGNEAQRDYVLTLELVDILSGEAEKVNADLRKEYKR